MKGTCIFRAHQAIGQPADVMRGLLYSTVRDCGGGDRIAYFFCTLFLVFQLLSVCVRTEEEGNLVWHLWLIGLRYGITAWLFEPFMLSFIRKSNQAFSLPWEVFPAQTSPVPSFFTRYQMTECPSKDTA